MSDNVPSVNKVSSCLGTKSKECRLFAEIAQESPCAAAHILVHYGIFKIRLSAKRGVFGTQSGTQSTIPCNIPKTQPLSASGPVTIGFHQPLP
jgi:hypothetical protein